MTKYDINVFLIKETINEFSEVLKDEYDDVDSYEIMGQYNINGIVYIGENQSNTPIWNDFLKEGVIGYEEDQTTRSTRAVLLMKRQDNIFAFTFGYGRYMLKNDSYVRGFGRRVVLNNIMDGNLKSVDTSIFDETPFNSTLQTSKSVLLSEFNITDIRTMFTSITAESKNADRYGAIVTGKDSFSFTYELNFENIKSVCDYLLEDYNDISYKGRFSEIDRIEEVSDPAKIAELDNKLIKQLRDRKLKHFYIPELIEWERVEGFSFTRKGDKDLSLSLDRFWDKREVEQKLSVDYLERHRIYCSYNDEVVDESWRIYDCLYTEYKEENTVYIFSIGQWFKVDQNLTEEINEFIKKVDVCELDFPQINGEHEADANKIFEQQLPTLLNLDRNNSKFEGDQYEVCDLLTKCKRFIHVKWWDSSATLSHLFSQGRVSGDFLLNSYEQRKVIAEKIKSQNKDFSKVINIDNYNASDYTVVYAIIYPENKSIVDRLPFFSKANLKHNVTLLRNMNYDVELLHIKTSRKRIKNSKNTKVD